MPRFRPFPDFPEIGPEVSNAVREAYLADLALDLAVAECIKAHQAKLQQIAVHCAYHLGRVKLLKGMLRAVDKRLNELVTIRGTPGFSETPHLGRAVS